MVYDPELYNFGQKAIESLGGVAEISHKNLFAYLPRDLADLLNLPEEVSIGEYQNYFLTYGSPVLDGLIDQCTNNIPIVYGKLQIPYLKKQGFEQIVQNELQISDSKISISNRAETKLTYLLLFCRYIALSDERKEGLTQICVRERDGAIIPGIQDPWCNHELQCFQRDKVPAHFPKSIDKALYKGMMSSRDSVAAQLSEFQKSMQRRLNRDVQNLSEYYQALSREMQESLEHPNLSQEQRQEREAKIEQLPLERDQKIEDLKHKYNIQVTIQSSAILRLLLDVVQLELQVKYKKWQELIYVTWNPVNRELDPLICPKCGTSTRIVFPRVEKERIRILCKDCV